MTDNTQEIGQYFIEGLSEIGHFWGLPRGMGAIFGVLYLSPEALSLDQLVEHTRLTKGAISTNVRALARLGLVHAQPRLGDRKDYYAAETDFYTAVRAILKERQNNEFDRAISTVQATIERLETLDSPDPQQTLMLARVRALKEFFDALDALAGAVTRLEGLGSGTVRRVLKVLG